MKITKIEQTWTVKATTPDEEKYLTFFFNALNELYGKAVILTPYYQPNGLAEQDPTVLQKTHEQTTTSFPAVPPFPGFRPRSPFEAEKTFPEWFARLDLASRLAWIYDLEDNCRPSRKKARNQGYGSSQPAVETS